MSSLHLKKCYQTILRETSEIYRRSVLIRKSKFRNLLSKFRGKKHTWSTFQNWFLQKEYYKIRYFDSSGIPTGAPTWHAGAFQTIIQGNIP